MKSISESIIPLSRDTEGELDTLPDVTPAGMCEEGPQLTEKSAKIDRLGFIWYVGVNAEGVKVKTKY